MSLLKRWRHLRNAHKDEGSLRNVLMELRDVVVPLGALNKQSKRAVTEVTGWGTDQTIVILKFLEKMNKYQIELNDSNTAFMDGYLEYVSAWKNILAERTELHALINEHKKAEDLIEMIKKRTKQAEKAEAKQRSRSGSASSPSRPAPPGQNKPPRPESPASPFGQAASRSQSGAASPDTGAAATAESGTASADNSQTDITPAPATEGHAEHTDPHPHRVRANTKCPSAKKIVPRKGSSVEQFIVSLEQAHELEKELAAQVADKMLEVQADVHENLRKGYLTLSLARMRLFKTGALITEKALADLREFPRVTGVDEKQDFVLEPFPDLPRKGYEHHWFKGDELQMTLDIEREAARIALEHERKLKETAIQALTEQHVTEIDHLTTRLQDLERQHRALVESLTSAAEQTEMSLQDKVRTLTLENHNLSENVRTLQATVVRLSLDEVKKGVQDATAGADQDVVAFALAKGLAAQKIIADLMAAGSVPNQECVIQTASLGRSVTAAVLSAVGTAQTVKQVEKARELLHLAKAVAIATDKFVDSSSKVIAADPTAQNVTVPQSQGVEVEKQIATFVAFLQGISSGSDLPQDVAKKVDAAMQFILDALKRIEEFKEEQRKLPEGRQREVNENMVQRSEDMMQHAKSVIDGALKMKASFGESGAQRSNAESQMLVRNWAEVLEQSIEGVIEFGPVWLECLRASLQHQEKFDEFQVSTRSIAAFSAQLVAFSRTVAAHGPDARATKEQVEGGTGSLIKTSHTLLEATREAQNLILASVLLDDLGSLTEMQAKKLVMNTQVEVLRLETALNREREKLGHLRRINYEDTRRSSVSKDPRGSSDASAAATSDVSQAAESAPAAAADSAASAAAEATPAVGASGKKPLPKPKAKEDKGLKRQTSVSMV